MPNLPDERNKRVVQRADGVTEVNAEPPRVDAKNPNITPSPPPPPPEPDPLPLEPSPFSPHTGLPTPGGPIAPNPHEPMAPDPDRERRRDDIKAPEPRPRNPLEQSTRLANGQTVTRTTVPGGDRNRIPVSG